MIPVLVTLSAPKRRVEQMKMQADDRAVKQESGEERGDEGLERLPK